VVGLGNDFPGLLPGSLEFAATFGVGLFGVGLGPVCRLELAANLILTLGQHPVERGQHLPPDDTKHDEERDQHKDKGPVGDEKVTGLRYGHRVSASLHRSVVAVACR
jgi:hypothetical protein